MASRASQIIIRIKGGVRAALEARAVAAGFEAVDEQIEEVSSSALAAAVALDVLSRAQRRVARANALIAGTSVPAIGGMTAMAVVGLPLGSVILPMIAVALWQVASAAAVAGASVIGAAAGLGIAVALMAAATTARFQRMKDVVGTAAYDLTNQLWLLRETFLQVTSAGADRLMAGLAVGAGRLLPLVRGLRDEFTAIGGAIGKALSGLGARIASLEPQISALLALVPDAIAALGHFAGDALTLFVQLATVGMPLLVSGLRTVAGWMRDLTDWFTPERVAGATSTLRAFFDGARAWWGEFTDPIAGVLGPAIDEASVGLQGWARPLGVMVATLMQIGRILLPPVSALLAAIGAELNGIDLGGLDVDGIASALVDVVAAVVGFGRTLVASLKPATPFLTNVLLPLLDGVIDGFGGPVLSIIKLFASALGLVGEALAPLRGAFYLTGQALSVIFGGALLKVAGGIARSIPLIGRFAGPVLIGLGRAWEFTGRQIGAVVGKVGSRLEGWSDIAFRVVTGIIGRITALVAFFAGLPGKVAHVAAGMFDPIKHAFRAVINWIIHAWNGLEFTLPSVNTHIPGVGRVGGFTLGTPDIPELAVGGVLQRAGFSLVGEHGPELAHFPTGTAVFPAATTRGLLSSDFQALRPARDGATSPPPAPVPLVADLATTVVFQADGRQLDKAVRRQRVNAEARA